MDPTTYIHTLVVRSIGVQQSKFTHCLRTTCENGIHFRGGDSCTMSRKMFASCSWSILTWNNRDGKMIVFTPGPACSRSLETPRLMEQFQSLTANCQYVLHL